MHGGRSSDSDINEQLRVGTEEKNVTTLMSDINMFSDSTSSRISTTLNDRWEAWFHYTKISNRLSKCNYRLLNSVMTASDTSTSMTKTTVEVIRIRQESRNMGTSTLTLYTRLMLQVTVRHDPEPVIHSKTIMFIFHSVLRHSGQHQQPCTVISTTTQSSHDGLLIGIRRVKEIIEYLLFQLLCDVVLQLVST